MAARAESSAAAPNAWTSWMRGERFVLRRGSGGSGNRPGGARRV
jgi:hypothetical protein